MSNEKQNDKFILPIAKKSKHVFCKSSNEITYFTCTCVRAGEHHTLVTIDPDVFSNALGTEKTPYLHGLITNIVDGNITSGNAEIL